MQPYTFKFGNPTPPNPRLADHRIWGASENIQVCQWLRYCSKTDSNENLISFIFELESGGAVWHGFPAVKTENKSSLCALWDIKVSDLNCFSLEGEWLYHLCETDPWSGLGMVLLSLKTIQQEELAEEVDGALRVFVFKGKAFSGLTKKKHYSFFFFLHVRIMEKSQEQFNGSILLYLRLANMETKLVMWRWSCKNFKLGE